MPRYLNADNLIDEVRSMLDEENQENISDTGDILPALNRAQDYASNILARHYEPPMLAYMEVNLGTELDANGEMEIPQDAFEDRVEKIEIEINKSFYPVKRLDYRDLSLYETPTKVNVPYYYVVIGKKIRFLPGSTGLYNARLWYLKDPPALVKQQGRITKVNTAGTDDYVMVDQVGSDLTTENTDLNSFVNLVDHQTGEVKASMQVKNLDGQRITFKSNLTSSRDEVLGRTISTALPADLAQDDWVCTIHGACVPFFKKPFSNFVIQYAVAELKRKLGVPADMELRVLQELEKQVERSWVGREQTLRVKKRSKNWMIPTRRYFNTDG